MKKLLLGVGLAALFATPGMAADISVEQPIVEENVTWYLSLHGGYKFDEDWDDEASKRINLEPDHPEWEKFLDIVADFEATTDSGIRVGGAAGYMFNNFFAGEIEISYLSQDFQDATLEHLKIDYVDGDPESDEEEVVNLVDAPCTGDCTIDLGGDVTVLTGMANAIFGYPVADSIRPYIGVGAGVANVSLDADAQGWSLDDSYTTFAVQAFAGVDVGITSNIAVGIRGRIMNVGDGDVEDDAGFSHEVNPDMFKSAEAVLTVGF